MVPRPGGTTADREKTDAWRASAYLDEDLFARRIRESGITPETFAELISGADFVADRTATAWAGELDKILAFPSDDGLTGTTVTIYGDAYRRVPFSGLLGRFAAYYRHALAEELGARAAPAAFRLGASAWPSLVSGLVDILVGVSHRTLITEINSARESGLLRGKTPERRYDYYDEFLLRDLNYLTELFTEYPVLGRAMVQTGENWLSYTIELLTRLDSDLAELRDEGFAAVSHCPEVVSIQAGLGDLHQGGRSVARVDFDSGATLIYKPRSLVPESLYARTTGLINELVGDLRLASMRVLVKPGHGWCEYLSAQACADEGEVTRFYFHLGGALAALHFLGATDIHMSNLLAVGSSPIPIDLETILQHTAVGGQSSVSAHERALDFLSQSVLATSVLPTRSFGDGINPGIDMSAVSGGSPQQSPKPLPSLAAVFTDEMRIEGVPRTLGSSRNRPVLPGREIDPGDHTADIHRGFLRVYDAICANRDLFAEILHESAEAEIRYLVRPTRRYDLFRYERFHPNYLRDGLDTEQLLDKLWTAATTRPDLIPVIEAEKRQLLDGDIPNFHARPGSTALYSGSALVAEDFFTEPSGTTIERKLGLFGPEHRAAQLTILDDSLNTLRNGPARRSGDTTPRAEVLEPGLLIELTRTKIQGLADKALLGRDDCTWIGIGVDGMRDQSLSYKPLGTNLYDGLAGMALMFGYAAAFYRNDHFAELSRRSIRPVIEHLRGAVRDRLPNHAGAFGGCSGVLFALDHLHAVTGDGEYFEPLVEALPYLETCAYRENTADLVSGLAGCAVVAARLHARHQLPELAKVVAICAERLAETAVEVGDGRAWPLAGDGPLLGGFSHGAAGIGWSLLEASRMLHDDAVRRLGEAALAYDNSLRIPGVHAWQDLRGFEDNTGITQEHPTLWCHGSTGIGMSRLLAHRLLPGGGYLDDAEVALAGTWEGGLLGAQSLCHGDFGIIELFSLAEQVFPEDHPSLPRWRRYREHFAASAVDSLRHSGFTFGRVSGNNVPGLMLGQAGVCLGLMRLMDPASAPAVPWLQPPGESPAEGKIR
ncbi:type 2 lanthipeptide synthetase LanM family protein [Amycolatopsis magusensis]|uniref:type 2 lanthipeptide synthetase LanM family protein n=1 Tax=Amycolatopsis magusensis TaxID=882444 RepID=UPI003C2C6A3E